MKKPSYPKNLTKISTQRKVTSTFGCHLLTITGHLVVILYSFKLEYMVVLNMYILISTEEISNMH